MSPRRVTKERLVAEMREVAWRYGFYSGFSTPADRRYTDLCRQLTEDGSSLLFTRDAGMHSCGWWKNPDYERCWHLSICYFDPETRKHLGVHSKRRSKDWCELFFRDWTRLIWAEPPYSEEGKHRAVWHYRVFVDPSWRVPILPRGEVYTRTFTERGWKSWSDLHGEPQESRHT